MLSPTYLKISLAYHESYASFAQRKPTKETPDKLSKLHGLFLSRCLPAYWKRHHAAEVSLPSIRLEFTGCN
jgi:hypothetical protein